MSRLKFLIILNVYCNLKSINRRHKSITLDLILSNLVLFLWFEWCSLQTVSLSSEYMTVYTSMKSYLWSFLFIYRGIPGGWSSWYDCHQWNRWKRNRCQPKNPIHQGSNICILLIVAEVIKKLKTRIFDWYNTQQSDVVNVY